MPKLAVYRVWRYIEGLYIEVCLWYESNQMRHGLQLRVIVQLHQVQVQVHQ